MSVCPASPPAFMDRSALNLAGRPGSGTENTSRDPYPWQPICCRGNKKIWINDRFIQINIRDPSGQRPQGLKSVAAPVMI